MKRKLLTALAAVALPIIISASSAFADYYPAYTLMRQGTQSSQVADLQQALKDLGYFTYKPTGYFGTITKQAVMVYQRDNNLMVDGIVGPQTAREIKIDKIIQTGRQYLGVPYAWGGTSPSGFDCSGFTHYVLLNNNIIIPRTTSLQYDQGTPVTKSQLKPGDLVFFSTYAPGPSHVGIYIGDNQFIHSSSSKGVIISSLSNSYYVQRYIGARRIVS